MRAAASGRDGSKTGTKPRRRAVPPRPGPSEPHHGRRLPLLQRHRLVPPTGEWLFFVDSRRDAIFRYRYDADTGSIGKRELSVDTRNFAGLPDGIAVDAEGLLWCAFWDGAALRAFASDGRPVVTIPVPALRPTSLCFGGTDMKTMFGHVRHRRAHRSRARRITRLRVDLRHPEPDSRSCRRRLRWADTAVRFEGKWTMVDGRKPGAVSQASARRLRQAGSARQSRPTRMVATIQRT